MIEQWQAQIKAHAARGEKIVLRGGGSKDGMGEFESAAGLTVLDTRAHTGVIAYEPDELVITARCGTPLAEVETLMRASNQMLAFEAPFAASGATIGGVVASGLSGARRPWAGSVRDFVLGAKIIDGKGDALTFGGQVMKNVAGFDVSRLQCGAWGTLGLVTEASFKCLPLPRKSITLRFEIPSAQFLENCARWAAQPLPISGAAWHDGVARVRLSGAEAAVNSAVMALGGEMADDDAWWRDLGDGRLPVAPGDADIPLWRVSVKSTAPIAFGEQQLIDWAGAQRLVRIPSARHAEVRAWASAQGGHATLLCQKPHPGIPRFQSLSPAVLAIHQRLKNTFDPYCMFNIGRMRPEF